MAADFPPRYDGQTLNDRRTPMSHTLHTEVPDPLWQQAQLLVRQGWANNVQDVINESLRRYLESHHDALAEAAVLEDVEWAFAWTRLRQVGRKRRFSLKLEPACLAIWLARFFSLVDGGSVI
jgi:hypothetical protein